MSSQALLAPFSLDLSLRLQNCISVAESVVPSKVGLHLMITSCPMRERDSESFSLTMCLMSWPALHPLSSLPTTYSLGLQAQQRAHRCKQPLSGVFCVQRYADVTAQTIKRGCCDSAGDCQGNITAISYQHASQWCTCMLNLIPTLR